MRIYMTGPLFSTAECSFNVLMAEQLRLHGHEVFLPQENEQGSDPTKIFLSDKAGIDWCQLVLANLDGPDPDSGTCWELGYGYGTNKAIMVYRTDFRLFEGADKINLMLTESANVVITAPKLSAIELAERIDAEIRHRFETPGQRVPRPMLMANDQYGGFDRDVPGTILTASEIEDARRARKGYPPIDRDQGAELDAAGIYRVPPHETDGLTPVYRHADK